MVSGTLYIRLAIGHSGYFGNFLQSLLVVEKLAYAVDLRDELVDLWCTGVCHIAKVQVDFCQRRRNLTGNTIASATSLFLRLAFCAICSSSIFQFYHYAVSKVQHSRRASDG